jgi:hypothetical protein
MITPHQAMATTIVSTTATKTTGISAMTESAIQRPSSRARRTSSGADRSAFPRSGCAMAIPIALTVPTRTRRCTAVQRHNRARTISSHATTDGASTRAGCAITTTTAAMARMRANSAMPNTKRARHKSSRARTLSASEISIDVVCYPLAYLSIKTTNLNPFSVTHRRRRRLRRQIGRGRLQKGQHDMPHRPVPVQQRQLHRLHARVQQGL